jgi:catechol 2,3-dioxygenase-like lactoylglutathione lyase family enzyme
MKFNCPLIVVTSIKKSREFYEKVLNQKVIMDFGENITFEGNFSLQSKQSWQGFIDKEEDEILQKSNNFELYFEEDDFEKFMSHLHTFESIEFVHGVKEYPWGQKVVRFYDPDGHIIEVGENMRSVIKHFLASGMSAEEAAERSQFPIDYVKSCME